MGNDIYNEMHTVSIINLIKEHITYMYFWGLLLDKMDYYRRPFKFENDTSYTYMYSSDWYL